MIDVKTFPTLNVKLQWKKIKTVYGKTGKQMETF